MIIIKSKITNKILHIVRKFDNLSNQSEQRIDLIHPNNFIQCASLKMNAGQTFKPHKHNVNKQPEIYTIAQESWIVLRGKVKAFFYDTNDILLDTHILEFGDCSFTLEGGHNYEILEDNTLVYEYKTGPYISQQLDKQFI